MVCQVFLSMLSEKLLKIWCVEYALFLKIIQNIFNFTLKAPLYPGFFLPWHMLLLEM
jgi:hypothetical protein